MCWVVNLSGGISNMTSLFKKLLRIQWEHLITVLPCSFLSKRITMAIREREIERDG